MFDVVAGPPFYFKFLSWFHHRDNFTVYTNVANGFPVGLTFKITLAVNGDSEIIFKIEIWAAGGSGLYAPVRTRVTRFRPLWDKEKHTAFTLHQETVFLTRLVRRAC